MKKLCRICNKPLPNDGKCKVLCSPECRHESHRRQSLACSKAIREANRPTVWEIDKICCCCGEDFKDDSRCHNRKRCHRCTKTDVNMGLVVRDKLCTICNSPYHDESKGNNRRTCSEKCAKERRRIVYLRVCVEKEKVNVDLTKCTWCGGRLMNRHFGEDGKLCSQYCESQKARVGHDEHVAKFSGCRNDELQPLRSSLSFDVNDGFAMGGM